jgi:uncharacterized phage infection (PIP) family protein YhgE
VPQASGQRLYDAQRDQEAQAALKLVGDLQSGSLFDKQLKNLNVLAKRDMEASLAAARVRMRADINSFTTWRDVHCVVGRVDRGITHTQNNSEIKSKLEDLNKRIGQAGEAFNQLKRETECKLAAGSDKIDETCPEAKPGQFDAFFEQAGQFAEIEEAVRSLSTSFEKHKNVTAAVDEAKNLIDRLKTLYENYRDRMNKYNQLKGELMDIRLQLKKVALQSLQVQAQHLKNTLKIRARREAEEADVIGMIEDYEEYTSTYQLPFDRDVEANCAPEKVRASGHHPLPPFANDRIEMELRDLVARVKYAEESLDRQKMSLAQQEADAKLDSAKQQATGRSHADSLTAARAKLEKLTSHASAEREQLSTKLFVLHLAAAISARGEIPQKMAALRQEREDHAFSIRKSAVMARAYQLTVAGGVKRLALYHKGGIKPSEIAQLIHTAATVAIPVVIGND